MNTKNAAAAAGRMNPERLAREFGPRISALAFRMIANRDTAREAAQETWCEILKSLPSFQGRARISTWIYVIAKRTILRYAKKDRVYTDAQIDDNFRRPEIDFTGNGGDRPAWVREKCDHCLTAFCHCLAAEERLIFLFHQAAGLGYREIARIMERTEAGVRQTAARSRRKVGHFLEENCYLFTRNAGCRCRIRKEIMKLDLGKEYTRCRKIVGLAGFFKEFDRELPRLHFWEALLRN